MFGEVHEKVIHLIPEVTMVYGAGISEHFVSYLNRYKYDKVFFVTEEVLFNLHGKKLYETIQASGVKCELVTIHATEEEKNMPALEKLCSKLIDLHISKDSFVVSFGGGIVGNVVGLAAAMIYRGVKYIEIPTTFMGQTDSSLSNKQAVNGSNGKNQLGVYSAPVFVWSDMEYIATESIRHIKAGITEGIKNGLISDAAFLDKLMPLVRNKTSFTVDELLNLYEIITDSKNYILGKDPSEKKYCVILEYGHTFGHAMEFLSKGRVIHGEAVAMGMCIAAEVGKMEGYLNDEQVALHYDLLNDFMYQLKDGEKFEFDADQIFQAIQNDNKRTKDGVKYVLLSTIGDCLVGDGDYQVEVEESVIKNAINLFFSKRY